VPDRKNPRNSAISKFKSQAEAVSRQLRAWVDSLQISEIKGQRYLDEKARGRQKATRDREEFLKELVKVRKEAAARQT